MILASTFVCALAAPALANPLNLVLNTSGDITSGFTDVMYHASTNQFTASGFALTLNDGVHKRTPSITNGAFDIHATIDDSGHASGGSLSVNGTIGTDGPTLVTGTLSNFGYSLADGGTFEFLFTVTGGSFANSFYSGIGSHVGVILNANGLNPGASGFGADFYNNFGRPGFGSGFANTGITAVPLPASVGLAALGFATIGWIKRRLGAEQAG